MFVSLWHGLYSQYPGEIALQKFDKRSTVRQNKLLSMTGLAKKK